MAHVLLLSNCKKCSQEVQKVILAHQDDLEIQPVIRAGISQAEYKQYDLIIWDANLYLNSSSEERRSLAKFSNTWWYCGCKSSTEN